MKSKKLISVVLALSMLFSLIGNFTAFADSPEVNGTDYSVTVKFRNDKTGSEITEGVKCTVKCTDNNVQSTLGANGTFDTTFNEQKTSASFEITVTEVPDGFLAPDTFSFISYSSGGDGYTIADEKGYNADTKYLYVNLTVTVDLTDTHNIHPVCGAECGNDCIDGSHEDVVWTKLTSDALDENGTLEAGNYCLAGDIETATSYTISDDTVI